jgi:hypothetical protein
VEDKESKIDEQEKVARHILEQTQREGQSSWKKQQALDILSESWF